MSSLTVLPRSHDRISYTKFIRFQVKQCIKPLIAASILMFAGNAYAVIDVGLAIENDLDSNGNITVINGSKVKVAYSVIEDTNNVLHKNDKIQLRRVSDNSVVASVSRGKKKSGSVSLKVKNSEDEQLYVNYQLKGGGDLITRTSHPGDPGFIALLSTAKASTADLTLEVNAMKTGRAVSVHASAFKDWVFGSAGCNYVLSSVWYGYYSSGSDCSATASVSLPDRVELSSINCRVFDSSFTGGWEITEVRLRRVDLTGTVSNVVDVFQTGTSDNSGFQTLSDSTPAAGTAVVDNSLYAYTLWIDFGFNVAATTAIRFYGCSIAY